jgi:hypothetical protein
VNVDANSLMSGLIGAVLGVLGAFAISVMDRTSRREDACRAVYVELVGNSSALLRQSTLSFVTRAAWESQFPLVLSAVTIGEGITLSAAYVGLGAFLRGELDAKTAAETVNEAVEILRPKTGRLRRRRPQ